MDSEFVSVLMVLGSLIPSCIYNGALRKKAQSLEKQGEFLLAYELDSDADFIWKEIWFLIILLLMIFSKLIQNAVATHFT